MGADGWKYQFSVKETHTHVGRRFTLNDKLVLTTNGRCCLLGCLRGGLLFLLDLFKMFVFVVVPGIAHRHAFVPLWSTSDQELLWEVLARFGISAKLLCSFSPVPRRHAGSRASERR